MNNNTKECNNGKTAIKTFNITQTTTTN